MYVLVVSIGGWAGAVELMVSLVYSEPALFTHATEQYARNDLPTMVGFHLSPLSANHRYQDPWGVGRS